MMVRIRLWLIVLSIFIFVLFIISIKKDCYSLKESTEINGTAKLFNLEFKYLIKNSCIKERYITTIQIVTSYAGKPEARSAIRTAYPKEELEKLGIFRVFLLGILEPGISEISQNEILHENETYNDIVQGNFLENYRNLTYKHVMGVRWAVTECEAEYIIKMDDDIVVDLYSLMELIDSMRKTKYDILGNIFNNSRPIRDKTGIYSKWYVTEDEYKDDIYPTYVNGWLYVIRYNAAKLLIGSVKSEPFFWIDDVFVTGVLAQKVSIIFEPLWEWSTDRSDFDCCIQKKEKCWFISGPSEKHYELNIDFQKHSKLCFEKKCKKTDQCRRQLS